MIEAGTTIVPPPARGAHECRQLERWRRSGHSGDPRFNTGRNIFPRIYNPGAKAAFISRA
jgi:hypothetical protein